MREIAEMLVPKAMYKQIPVKMIPPVSTVTTLAGWGAAAGFGLFWPSLLLALSSAWGYLRKA